MGGDFLDFSGIVQTSLRGDIQGFQEQTNDTRVLGPHIRLVRSHDLKAGQYKLATVAWLEIAVTFSRDEEA